MNNTHLGASSQNCKDAIECFGQPMINLRDCLRATPLYTFTHQRPNGWVRSVLAPTNKSST